MDVRTDVPAGSREQGVPIPAVAAEPEAARKAAAASGPRVVVGVDTTPAGLAALQWAVRQARSSGEPLVAVRSWALGLPRHGGRRRRHPPRMHPHVVLSFDGTEQRSASAELVRRSFQVIAGGVPHDVTVTIRTPEADPAAALADFASSPDDTLVIGREPALSLHRLVHGSVGRYLCGHARCPVVLVPASGDHDREDAP